MDYPPALQVAPKNPEFNYQYAGIPAFAPELPHALTGPVGCTSTNINTCSWGCNNCIRPADKLSCQNKNHWSLTYDDGPTRFTPHILDWLQEKKLKATFFVVGGQVVKAPEVLTRIYSEGHEIGIHTWSHKALTTLTNDEIISEIQWTLKAIRDITGYRPKYVRPPFGDMDDRVRELFRFMNLIPVIWNFDSKDYMLNVNPAAIPSGLIEKNASNFVSSLSRVDGVISLQHDLTLASASRGPTVGNAILETGMKIVSLNTCLGFDQAGIAEPSITNPANSNNSARATDQAEYENNSSFSSTYRFFNLFSVLLMILL